MAAGTTPRFARGGPRLRGAIRKLWDAFEDKAAPHRSGRALLRSINVLAHWLQYRERYGPQLETSSMGAEPLQRNHCSQSRVPEGTSSIRPAALQRLCANRFTGMRPASFA